MAAFLSAALLCLSPPARADWFAPVYQKTYELWNQVDCSDASVRELSLIPSCRQTPISHLHRALADVRLKTNDVDAAVTEEFFNHGAHAQLANYKCQTDRSKVLINGSVESDKALATFANDLNLKLPSMRIMRTEIDSLVAKRERLQSRHDTQNAYSGDAYKKINADIDATDKALARARIQFAATLNSTPLGRFPSGISQITELIARPSGALTAHGAWQTFKTEIDAIEGRKQWLLGKQKAPGKFALSQGDKEKLFQNGEPETWLDSAKANSALGKGLMCRMNGRYGEGVKDFQTAMFIGSFAFWGGGLALKAGAASLRSLTTAVGLRSSAVPVVANYMISGSYIPTFAYAFKNVESKCSSFRLDAYANSCVMNPAKEIELLKERNCMYAAAMLGVNAAFPALGSPAVKASIQRISTKLGAP